MTPTAISLQPDDGFAIQQPQRGLGMKIPYALALGLAAMSSLAMPLQASAAVITNYAFVQTQQQLCGPTGCGNSVVYANQLTQSSMQGAGLNVAVASSSGATTAGTIAGSAAADLSTGTLKGAISAQGIVAGSHAFSVSQSRIADTFTIANNGGTPYTGSGLSTFHLDITGLLALTGHPDLFGGVAIGIYQVGYFDRFWSGDYAGASLLRIDGASIGIDSASTFPTTLDFSFATPASFEWEIQLYGAGVFDQDTAASMSFDLDLGHTIKASFSGPDGTTVSSASGYVLPAVAAAAQVPEPSSMALTLLALAACGSAAVRRRARSASDVLATQEGS